LHMAQLMPLPLTVSCFSKIQIGFTFLVPAHLGSPGQRAVKQVCETVKLVAKVELSMLIATKLVCEQTTDKQVCFEIYKNQN